MLQTSGKFSVFKKKWPSEVRIYRANIWKTFSVDQDRETAKACRFFFLNIFLFPSSENPLSMSSLNCISTLILTLLAKKNKQKHLSGSCGMSCFSAQRCGFCTRCPLSDGSLSWKDN